MAGKPLDRKAMKQRISDGPRPGPVVKRAIEKYGGLTPLAKALGLPRQNVFQWRRIPAEWVVPVERVTGIPRAELRPDIFGPANSEELV